MIKVLILGANGQLARNTTRVFLENTDVALTLYLRRSGRLRNPDPARVKIVEGDVLDAGALLNAARRRGRRNQTFQLVSWDRTGQRTDRCISLLQIRRIEKVGCDGNGLDCRDGMITSGMFGAEGRELLHCGGRQGLPSSDLGGFADDRQRRAKPLPMNAVRL